VASSRAVIGNSTAAPSTTGGQTGGNGSSVEVALAVGSEEDVAVVSVAEADGNRDGDGDCVGDGESDAVADAVGDGDGRVVSHPFK
jgi:hypothetical protein